MHIRFLGTGAADWNGPDERGEYRRLTSLLVNEHILIDFTADKLDTIGVKPDVVLITHSHADHYDPDAIRKLAPERVYAHESWARDAERDDLPVTATRYGEEFVCGEVCVLPLPANHSTGRPYETPCGYLLTEGTKRFLYMTDSAWIPREASLLIGNEPLDAMAMDSTIGPMCADDWRVFEHTSVQMTGIMVNSLHKSGRLRADAPVFLTHMARTLWPTQREAEAMLRAPYVIAYDGLEADI